MIKECIVLKQTNGLYTLIIKKRFLFCFTKSTIVKDMTSNQVRHYEIPWCVVITGDDVPIDVCPRRIFIT